MIPIIKSSRLAASNVALRRHPRLMPAPDQDIGQRTEGGTGLAAEGVHRSRPAQDADGGAFSSAGGRDGMHDDGTICRDADAAPCSAGAQAGHDRCTDRYDLGFEEGQRAGWHAGHVQGLREGLQTARDDAGAAARVQADALQALGAAIRAACTGRRDAIEADAIDIAYAAVLRLVGESAGNRTVVAGIVGRVMEQVQQRAPHDIRVSPADHALLQHAHDLHLDGAQLVADEQVGFGGCIIDTDAGSLDGRLETQLSELKDLLVELHRAHALDGVPAPQESPESQGANP